MKQRDRRSGTGNKHPALIGEDHQLRPIVGVDLRHDAIDVRLRSVRRDEQLIGDLLIRPPARHEQQHLALALGEGFHRRMRGRGRDRAGDIARDEAAGRRGREQGIPGVHREHRAHDLFGFRALAEESAGARAQSGHHVLVLFEGREDQDASTGVVGVGADRRGRLDAVSSWHPNVHQHHIGPQRRGLRDRLGAVNLVAALVLVLGIYYRRHRRRDLVVAFLGVNVGVFAVAAVLGTTEIALGLGLGLFGVLSIIRLRSSVISQREVAYYFAALAMGLIGGLTTTRLVLPSILIALIVSVMWFADHPLLLPRSRQQTVKLDRAYVDETELREELSRRLGATVTAVTVKHLDLVGGTTVVDVRFHLEPRRATANHEELISQH